MGWPQIVMIILFVFDLVFSLVKDGEPEDGNYSFAATFITDFFIFLILSYGGFWK